jgi:hypothetical protein
MSEEKRVKKLAKEIEGTIVQITAAGGTKGQMLFDFADLPADIQSKLGPFGLGHKLGDAAAGKEGAEAEEAIEKVFEGLKSGDWSVPWGQDPWIQRVSRDPPPSAARRDRLLGCNTRCPNPCPSN